MTSYQKEEQRVEEAKKVDTHLFPPKPRNILPNTCWRSLSLLLPGTTTNLPDFLSQNSSSSLLQHASDNISSCTIGAGDDTNAGFAGHSCCLLAVAAVVSIPSSIPCK
jgi:hypothetical protein